jgi:nitrite reductase/ring-hydroxylating ferredoxin subunit
MEHEVAVDLMRRAVKIAAEQWPEMADAHMEVPLEYFTSDEIAARERHLFETSPLALVAASELAAPNDYLVRNAVGRSVLLTRDEDGVAHAFLNYCRHRGAEPAHGCGNARRFTCPYHAWVYDTKGQVVGMPLRNRHDGSPQLPGLLQAAFRGEGARTAADLIVWLQRLSRTALYAGRTRRTVTRRQRTLPEIRDRHCQFPGCTVEPGRCEAHHVQYWRNGGRTDLDALAPLCNRHHTRSHAEGWTYQHHPHGHLAITTPNGTQVPTRRPRKPGEPNRSRNAPPGALFDLE